MDAARITWLGHATVLVELDGLRLLTDPVLRRRVAHLRRHAMAPAMPERLDAVLVSHLHRDHADVPTLRGLPPGVPILGPPGTAAVLRPPRFAGREVGAGDGVGLGGGVVIAVLPADHDVRRDPLGRRTPAIGFVVEGTRRVYFPGDTDLFDGMADIGRPALDLALLPVWGWGPSIGPGHLDPAQAAQAVALLRPAVAVPIHWGTYLPLGRGRKLRALLVDPAREFRERAADLVPDVRVEVLEPGDDLIIAGD